MGKIERMTDAEKEKTSAILELYTCIQSEGSRQGRPTVAIRTTGCTHRCWFGAGGWCDSFYTSIHPEKAKYGFNDIIKIYDENPHIREMMLTGGSPTMFPKLCNELTHFANERGIFITIETEGSHFIETDYPFGLISLSPKFSNSVPKIDVTTPMGKLVDQKMIDKHNSLRLNHQAIEQTLAYHSDYHYKPVYDGTEETMNEIEEFRVRHNIPKNKTWLMPAGDNREELIKQYPISLEKAFEMGYNWTGRDHIISYDQRRAV
jgi:7-carboxy-7-deazaguanine synthase